MQHSYLDSIRNDGSVRDLDKTYMSVKTYLATKPIWYQRLETKTGPFDDSTVEFITRLIERRLKYVDSLRVPKEYVFKKVKY
jgi:hypothetical protein